MQETHLDDAASDGASIRRIAQQFIFACDVCYSRGGKEVCRRTVEDGVVQLRLVGEQAMPAAFVMRDRLRRGDPTELTIHRFDSALWWPVVTARGVFDGAEFRRGLAAGEERSLALFDPAMVPSPAEPRGNARIPSKAIKGSSRDEQIAVAHREVADLVICGGGVYIRGGEPMFICPAPGEVVAPFSVEPIQLVDPTIRRLAYRSRGPLPVGYARPLLLRNCARKGRIFRADELDRARALVLAEGGRFEPRLVLESLGDQSLQSDPVAIHLAASLAYMSDRHFSKLDYKSARKEPCCVEAINEIRYLAASGTHPAKRMFGSLEKFRDCLWGRENLVPDLRAALEAVMTEIEGVLDHCGRRGVAVPAELRPEEERALEELARSQG